MGGWQLIEVGVILALASRYLASQYLKADVPQQKPGLSLHNDGPLRAPPGRHARRVAWCYGAVAMVGVALIVVGLFTRAPEPPPRPRPEPGTEPVPVRFHSEVPDPAAAADEPATTE